MKKIGEISDKNIKERTELKEEIKNKEETKKSNKIYTVNSRIKDYLGYSRHLQDNGWIKEPVTLHENLSAIVTINNLKANNKGMVIDIRCPPGHIMTIVGKNSMPEEYSIESIHSFEAKFANSDGVEIDRATQLIFMIDKVTKKSIQIDTRLYEDISSTNFEDTPNRFKDCSKLFRFDDGVEIKEEEHLGIHVINPDIDIMDVKFNLFADLWRY